MSAAEITPEKRSIWIISHFHLVLGCAAVVFLVLAHITDRKMITGLVTDGFFAQIRDIAFSLETNTFDPVAEPLYAVHLVRFLIVYPWFMAWLNGMPAIVDALLLLPLLLTVALARFNNRYSILSLLIFLLPLAFSYRTILVIVGMANLYIVLYSDKKEPWRIYLSGLLAFLSSGVTLAWLIVIFINARQFTKQKIALYTAIFILFASLIASIAQKIRFFSNAPSGASKSSGILSALERNTIFMSYNTDDTKRFLAYCIILAAVTWFLVTIYKMGEKYRTLLYFFLTAAASFVFEGLGPIAFLMPIAWVMSGNLVIPKPTQSTLLPQDAG
jgi:hypothetical protein